MVKRLFFALWPDATAQQQLEAISRKIVHTGDCLLPDNLHVTLLYIGHIDSSYLTEIYLAAARIRAMSITLEFNELDYWKQPRVLCLTCQRQPSGIISIGQSVARGYEAVFASYGNPALSGAYYIG